MTAAGPTERRALLACLAAGFATLFDSAAITYAAPAVNSAMGGGTAAVQWLLASFSLTFGLGLIPGGRLGDLWGRRRLFVLGLAVFAAGGLVSVLAPSVPVLIGARFAQGLGAGIISAQVLGTMQDLFTGAARLRALGLYTGAGAAAALLGPLSSALVLVSIPEALAWRAMLLLPLPFAMLAAALGARSLPDAPVTRTRRHVGLDLPGIVLLCSIVVAVTLPVISPDAGADIPLPGAPPRSSAARSLLLVAGLVGLLALWEVLMLRRGSIPLLAPQLIASRGFVTGNVAAMLWFGSSLSLSTALTVHVLQRPDLSPLTVALLFAPGALSRLLASLCAGRIVAALGRRTVPAGLALQAGLMLSVALLAPALPAPTLLVSAAVAQVGLGAAGGIVEPQLRVLTLSFSPPHLHGAAGAFLQLTQRLAATFLIALTTGLLLGTGAVSTPESLRTALLACTLASAGALAVSFVPALHRPAMSRLTGAARAAESPGAASRPPVPS